MRLKNKETGKTYNVEIRVTDPNTGVQGVIASCASLAQVQEKWEDVLEEPKTYWHIYSNRVLENECDGIMEDWFKEIGNYFETKEEAEKVLKKLKAFKRLKDKGFRFTLTPVTGSLDITPDKFQIEINADMPAKWFCCDAVQKDLDDCFGGDNEQD